ncbi:lytic transglycosylase domain-containing protein [Lysobacter sp.]|uniref:lytic transglycosylase domain-containing protein n=1 Tax=Lysobacter sp. TaxID=72226 RepID=UPI0039C91C22
MRTAGLCLALTLACPALAQQPEAKPDATGDSQPLGTSAATTTRNGLEIYRAFREGLAEPECDADATSPRWRQHFAHVPKRLAASGDDVLPLFGYVVDALREASIPTEFALIPFVESGYRPGARSAAGPAGLWQMISVTARDHGVPMRAGYDGRLSPVDSTRAAVRYLKTLHGMFAGDWRLAGMAYNAGEYRVLNALKRSGQVARDAKPEKLVGLSDITTAYVRKLHALSCLIEQADDREEWMQALDRDVPRLETIELPDNVRNLDQWASRSGQDAKQLRRLNPVFAEGRVTAAAGSPVRLLAVAGAAPTVADADVTAQPSAQQSSAADNAVVSTSSAPRRHTVARGESLWTIARRYQVATRDLLQRNGLAKSAVLKPGQTLVIDALDAPPSPPAAAAGSP